MLFLRLKQLSSLTVTKWLFWSTCCLNSLCHFDREFHQPREHSQYSFHILNEFSNCYIYLVLSMNDINDNEDGKSWWVIGYIPNKVLISLCKSLIRNRTWLTTIPDFSEWTNCGIINKNTKLFWFGGTGFSELMSLLNSWKLASRDIF